MTMWAESKVQPGLFTGSTGVKPLSVAELSSGCQAWPKKVIYLEVAIFQFLFICLRYFFRF